jgi:hypothetical protein
VSGQRAEKSMRRGLNNHSLCKLAGDGGVAALRGWLPARDPKVPAAAAGHPRLPRDLLLLRHARSRRLVTAIRPRRQECRRLDDRLRQDAPPAPAPAAHQARRRVAGRQPRGRLPHWR